MAGAGVEAACAGSTGVRLLAAAPVGVVPVATNDGEVANGSGVACSAAMTVAYVSLMCCDVL
jgi:hypothetical protein